MLATEVPLRVVWMEADPDTIALLRVAVDGEPDFELVATTGSADAFLDLVREHHPDVLILDDQVDDHPSSDATFPRGVAIAQTGLELVDAVRSMVPDATIVIFTNRPGLAAAAHNVGADACIEKPAWAAVWPSIREARAAKDRSASSHGTVDLRDV